MAEAKMVKLQDTVSSKLEAMISRTKDPRPFLEKVYKTYVATQAKRWQAENADPNISPGPTWPKLTEAYSKRKLKKFASFPGGGQKIMVASGTLVNAVLGRNEHARKLISQSTLVVAVDLPYAKYANDPRNFTKFSKAWINKLKQDYVNYLSGGIK